MKKLLFILLPLCLGYSLNAQSIISLLEEYDAKAPQEKIHIHFDNNTYTPGQTVFFKAYLLKGTELSDLSKDLYINWFDETGNLVDRTVAPSNTFMWSGSFTIPVAYTGKQLNVLAYTKWMLNFDSAFLFRRSLGVTQVTADNNDKKAIARASYIHFFPEGGDLVENVSSMIAFKVLDQAGIPVNAAGIVTNENKEVVAKFSAEHDGMGKFTLKPLPGNTYTAEWKDERGITHYTDLPSAKRSGIVLSVSNEKNTPSFSIERPLQSDARFRNLSFVATMNQKVVLYADVNLNPTSRIVSNLVVKNYPSGILQLTVLDADGKPVAERILFINNEEYILPVILSADTLDLTKRGKNTYSIELSDTIQSSLSLSITAGETNDDSSQNIISQLLLSSDIKGHIHNPAYYFSGADSARHYLDLVMLTNGWRRFKWDDVLKGRSPVLNYQHDTGYLSVSGKITELKDEKIRKAGFLNLVLMGKDSTRRYVFTSLQADGSFRENNLLFFDTVKIFYQLNKTFLPSGSKISIGTTLLPFDNKMKSFFPSYFRDTSGNAYDLALAVEQQKLEGLMKNTTLKEVVVRSKVKARIEELDERYTSGSFNGDGIRLNVVDDVVSGGFQNVLTYLQSRAPVAGLTFGMTNPPVVSWRGGGRKGDAETAFFLDQIQMKPIDIMAISMADVAYIKIFRPPFEMAFLGGPGGAIAVYTKKGGDSKQFVPSLNYSLIAGYTPVKEFYSPDYGEQKLTFLSKDLRRTLYWQPDIRTDGSNKKIRVSFYNNDISHSLRFILEGIAADGRMIQVSKLLK